MMTDEKDLTGFRRISNNQRDFETCQVWGFTGTD